MQRFAESFAAEVRAACGGNERGGGRGGPLRLERGGDVCHYDDGEAEGTPPNDEGNRMQPKSTIGKKIAAIAKVADEQSQKAGAAAGKQLDKAKKVAGEKLGAARKSAGKKLGEVKVAASKKVAKAKKDWQEMDPKKKKKVVAGGVAAAAVAAAIAIPIAVKKARAKKRAKAAKTTKTA